MTGKRIFSSRGLTIAIAIIVLMTLTAGTAAAAANNARKIEATGSVVTVGLGPGGTVESKFKFKKNGELRSVKIGTIGEIVSGTIDDVTKCDEKGKHSEGACQHAEAVLEGGGIVSIHSSNAQLKVSGPAYDYYGTGIEVISGKLKGNLGASLNVWGANGEFLTGDGNLKIRSTELESSYACLLGVTLEFDEDGLVYDEITGLPVLNPAFVPIQTCIDLPGPNAFGIIYGPIPAIGLPTYVVPNPTPSETEPFIVIPNGGPVMVPIELHVKDSGSFMISSETTTLKGKIEVTVDSGLTGTSGTITLSKGSATFSGDHDHTADPWYVIPTQDDDGDDHGKKGHGKGKGHDHDDDDDKKGKRKGHGRGHDDD
jgi:hypothetical protein